jgi:protein phosphatase methylesterase 1
MDNMSDLQRAFVKAKLAKYPPDIPIFDENEEDTTPRNGAMLEEEGEEFDSSSTSSASSAGTVVPSPSRNLFAKPNSLSVYSTFLHMFGGALPI